MLPTTCSDAFEGELQFDLGNLTAFDPSPVNTEQFAADSDAACLSVASKITQALVAQLFALPSEAVDVGRVAQLPPPTTALPRAKPVPKPREPTKWEKFAQQRGITKHKRSREVWDEDTKEFKRRHGFNSIRDDQPAIIDAKASDQVRLSLRQSVQNSDRELLMCTLLKLGKRPDSHAHVPWDVSVNTLHLICVVLCTTACHQTVRCCSWSTLAEAAKQEKVPDKV